MICTTPKIGLVCSMKYKPIEAQSQKMAKCGFQMKFTHSNELDTCDAFIDHMILMTITTNVKSIFCMCVCLCAKPCGMRGFNNIKSYQQHNFADTEKTNFDTFELVSIFFESQFKFESRLKDNISKYPLSLLGESKVHSFIE